MSQGSTPNGVSPSINISPAILSSMFSSNQQAFNQISGTTAPTTPSAQQQPLSTHPQTIPPNAPPNSPRTPSTPTFPPAFANKMLPGAFMGNMINPIHMLAASGGFMGGFPNPYNMLLGQHQAALNKANPMISPKTPGASSIIGVNPSLANNPGTNPIQSPNAPRQNMLNPFGFPTTAPSTTPSTPSSTSARPTATATTSTTNSAQSVNPLISTQGSSSTVANTSTVAPIVNSININSGGPSIPNQAPASSTPNSINTVVGIKRGRPMTNILPSTALSSGTNSGSSQHNKKRKRNFTREIRIMMYGFGDVADPLPESVDLVEDLLLEYVHDMTCEAMQIAAQRNPASIRLQHEDLMFLVRKDKKKYGRVKELIRMNEELQNARKAFDFDEKQMEGEK